MKKIVFLGALVAAIAAQAASLTWTTASANMIKPGTTSKMSGAGAGYMWTISEAQYTSWFNGGTATAENMAAIYATFMANDTPAAGYTAMANNYTGTNAKYQGNTFYSGVGKFTETATASGDYYRAFVYTYTDSAGQAYYMTNVGKLTEGSTLANLTLENLGTTWGGSNGSNSIQWTAVGGGESTPEPTSGLLLLVGGAMLALRRRRA